MRWRSFITNLDNLVCPILSEDGLHHHKKHQLQLHELEGSLCGMNHFKKKNHLRRYDLWKFLRQNPKWKLLKQVENRGLVKNSNEMLLITYDVLHLGRTPQNHSPTPELMS